MGYNLLINGVYWGYNPLTNHLLTSWDIQVQPSKIKRTFAVYEVFVLKTFKISRFVPEDGSWIIIIENWRYRKLTPIFFGGFFSSNLKKSRSRIMDSFFKTSVFVFPGSWSFPWFSMVFLDPNGSDPFPGKHWIQTKKNPKWRFPRLQETPKNQSCPVDFQPF